MTAFAACEDRLRRPVVLLERDHRDIGKRLLELQDVANVRSAKSVDAVVHEHAVRDVSVHASTSRSYTGPE